MSVHKFYKHPVAVLIFGAILISFSGVFVKPSQVYPLVSAFYRVFFGCLFLTCACWVKREFKAKSLKKNLLAILCGLVFSVALFCWHLSIHYVGSGLATILGNCQAFAWVLISNSLPRIAASRAGLILLLQPALSFFWDVLFFNRQTGIAGWAGVAMVLAAIYLGMTGGTKTKILTNKILKRGVDDDVSAGQTLN